MPTIIPEIQEPIRRVRVGASYLGVIVVAAYIGYRLFGYDSVAALWMVVVTVSSVGYGEKSAQGWTFQLFTIGVILTGMTAATYTLGGLVQVMLHGEVSRALGKQRTVKEISKLNGHVIICGYGRMGQILARELENASSAGVVVVDQASDRISDAQANHLCIIGDAREESVLLAAGVDRAATMVSALSVDADNVFIALTTRNLRPDIQIIARAEHQSSEKKLLQAGANQVVLPAAIGAHKIVRMITHPHTAEMIEVVSRGNLDVEIDEFLIEPNSKLAGVKLKDAADFRKFKLLIIAVRQNDGEMVFNPGADYQINGDDTLMVMGKSPDIQAFLNSL